MGCANVCRATFMDNDATLFFLLSWLKPVGEISALQNDTDKLQCEKTQRRMQFAEV